MLHKCISCNIEKERIDTGTRYKNRQRRYIDDKGKVWSANRCPECCIEYNRKLKGHSPRKPAKKKPEKVPQIKNCKKCGSEFVAKRSTRIYCSEKCRYTDRYTKIKPVEKNCRSCDKIFAGSSRQKLCSPGCGKQNKPTYKKVDHPEKPCKTCGTQYKPKTAQSSYCKTTCMPSYRKQKLFRRSIRRCKHQLISKKYRSEISDIYQNRPDNHHVDHIIPLSHPDVCGLHVPWNLQYLPANENMKKSNNF